MPISAMPEHINTQEKIDAAFPDDSQYGNGWFGRLYRRYQKQTKTWFAFSYRCTEWWAKWRLSPKVLFKVGGKGDWRYEQAVCDICLPVGSHTVVYLSRIQYWKRWHLAIQWPLLISFHFYFHQRDVPIYGEPMPDTDGKLLFFYWNHFDADLIYFMLTSIYIGCNWK